MPEADFIRVSYPVPHHERARRILSAHPEIRALIGHTPRTALFVGILVALQLAVGIGVRGEPWWAFLLAAYVVGATVNHALFVLIHECAHNLVFRQPFANRLVAVFANIPLGVPVAIPFCRFHLLHHWHQGEATLDPDVPGRLEARLIGRSRLAKTIWLALFWFVQGVVRPMRFKGVRFLDAWTVVNIAVQAASMALVIIAAGWTPVIFFSVSTFFAVGLHPLGARWIQEHYVFADGQETYSYYGPLNKVAFNIGFHNEHHDLPAVACSRLPQVRALAPEFYESLHAYGSWTGVLWRFITDSRLGPDRRIVRPDRAGSPRIKPDR